MSENSDRKVDMDVVVTKVLALVIITGVTVIIGLLPYRLVKHCRRTMFRNKDVCDNMVCGAKCFSGGVFLGACFLHLIPEVRKKVDTVLEQLGTRSHYPVAELLTMAGFFAVVFCEHVIRYLYIRLQRDSCFPSFDRDSYSFDQDYLPTTEDPDLNPCELIECKSLRSSSSQQSMDDIQAVRTHTNQQSLPKPHQNQDESQIHISPNNPNNIIPKQLSGHAENRFDVTNHSNTHKENECDVTNHSRARIEHRFDMEIEPAPLQDLEVKTVVTEISRGEEGKSQVRSVLLLTALSFHGVFEGMALGLQAHQSDVWVMCVAICIHRGILSFGLSLQYARSYEKASTIVFSISAFSIICAVGIIIGIAISTGAQLYTDVDVPNAILQSLATGTIFYIIFLNILFKELDGNRDVKKISCTFVGFAFIAIVLAVAKQ